jgi:DNA-binding NarL/FixJ family response regulator
MNNTVVIASTADCLAKMLSVKLDDVNYKVYTASNDRDLFFNINNYFPKYIFMENCFSENVTEEYVYKIKRTNENLHIIIWTASAVTPRNAARFIHAGAESFISLREKDEDVKKILKNIMLGINYCSDDVTNAYICNTSLPIYDIPLSEKDIKFIKLIHLSDKEIAIEMCISPNTVHYHKKIIFRKIGAKRKSEVIKWAINNGIIEPNEN